MSDDLLDVVKAEIDRQVALRQNVLSALDDPEQLEAIGGRLGRHGTQEHVLTNKPKVDDQETAFLLWAYKSRIDAEVAARLGAPHPKNIDEIVASLREIADRTYAEVGLPTGSDVYSIAIGLDEADLSNWEAGKPSLRHAKLKLADDIAKLKPFDMDHPVSHAGHLHWCAWELETAIKREPLDLLYIVRISMAAQSAADTLHAVTAKRRRSGLTDAEAVWRGDDNIATLKTATDKAKTIRHEKRKPALEAAEAILKEPGNRQFSMNALLDALASRGLNHDAKALTKWIKEAGLMIKREGNSQGYKPNPTLFAK